MGGKIQISLIIELHKSGMKTAYIVQTFSINQSTVSDGVKRFCEIGKTSEHHRSDELQHRGER